MSGKIMPLLAFALILTISACGHVHKVEQAEVSETPKSPAGVQVNIGSKELQPGDKVAVLKSLCAKKYRGRSGYRNECSYKPIGEALVLKIIDENSSIVQPDDGVTIDLNSRFEKKK